MNYYFFLQAPRLDCEIGLANFAPSGGRDERPCYICHAQPVDGTWKIATLGEIGAREACAVRPADLGLDQEGAARTLVFLSPERLDGARDRLPRYAGFDSIPAWRANLKVLSGTTSASYQGDFPAEMLDIPGGNLLSISAMLQSGVEVANGVFFVSFKATAESVEATLEVTRVADGALLKRAPVWSNRVNFIDLSGIAFDRAPGLVALSSTGLAGIPIYLSRDRAARCLSLEHTHPPAELTAFGEPGSRYSVIGRMRAAWLRRLRHA